MDGAYSVHGRDEKYVQHFKSAFISFENKKFYNFFVFVLSIIT